MKTVLLHGLGQTAQDWKEVVCQLSTSNVECPELFSSTGDEISYFRILADLERQYSNATEPLRICGLSFGALLALDFTIRHGNKVDSLILIGAQYKVPTLLIDFQNFLFRCMPNKSFENMGLSKRDTIKLSHSMRSLDFTSQLNGITCPVTILCGEKDSANLKASKKLNGLLPQATLQIIPGAGHEITSLRCGSICREPKSSGVSVEEATVEKSATEARAVTVFAKMASSPSPKDRIINFPCGSPPITSEFYQ